MPYEAEKYTKKVAVDAIRKCFLLVVLAWIASACNPHREETSSGNGVVSLWQQQQSQSEQLLKNGEYDRYIAGFKECLQQSVTLHDTVSMQYSCAYIAQAYLFTEDVDSALFYLNRIERLEPIASEAKLKILLANVKGLYAIKFEMNLSKALDAFQTGYRLASSSNVENKVSLQISFLVNMGNIFFIRSDVQGMDYAKQALSLMNSTAVDDYTRSLVYVNMAMMLQLTGDYANALSYIEKAHTIALHEQVDAVKPVISLLYANHYARERNLKRARGFYEQALADSSVIDNGTRCLAYLSYGRLFEQNNRFDEAVACYKKGLWLSSRFGNAEFRKDFFHRLSHLLYVKGDKEQSIKYFHDYWFYLDTVSPLKQEQRFDRLMRSYQQAKYDNELQHRELELLQAKKRTSYTVAVLIVILVIFFAFLMLFRHQRAMYHRLYMQHQKYLHSLDAEDESTEHEQQDDSYKLAELFARIEKLMKQERIYRQKDISLTGLAEHLDTNKTYVSVAINRFSRQTFRDYIASYRIRDAVAIISNPQNRIPLKQLADELGFNSISVFNKTFLKETGLPPGQYRKEARGKISKIDDVDD